MATSFETNTVPREVGSLVSEFCAWDMLENAFLASKRHPKATGYTGYFDNPVEGSGWRTSFQPNTLVEGPTNPLTRTLTLTSESDHQYIIRINALGFPFPYDSSYQRPGENIVERNGRLNKLWRHLPEHAASLSYAQPKLGRLAILANPYQNHGPIELLSMERGTAISPIKGLKVIRKTVRDLVRLANTSTALSRS